MKPVLLLGDSCIDKFVYCKCERLCPEAPIPLLDIIKSQTMYLMAAEEGTKRIARDIDIYTFIKRQRIKSSTVAKE